MSVAFDKQRNKFVVRVQRGGKRHFGGRFATIEEAMAKHAEIVRELDQAAKKKLPKSHTLDGFELHYEHQEYRPFTFPEEVSVLETLKKVWKNFVNKLYLRA